MLNLPFVVFIGLSALLVYAVYYLEARTPRELRIPFEKQGFPRQVARETLEKIGCTITHDSSHRVCGTLPMRSMSWGQEISVTFHNQTLVVRSAFLMSQVFGGSINQENVERFALEWKNRSASCHADPGRAARHETFTRENAKQSSRIGALMAIAAGLIVAIAIWPSSSSGSSSGKYRLIALGLPVFLMGCASLCHGLRRLRERPKIVKPPPSDR